jgi:Uma2 family endonuclease
MAVDGGTQSMTIAILPTAEGRLRLDLRPWPDLSEDEFFELCAANRELRMERLATGEIIIMPPAGGESGYRNMELLGGLAVWTTANGRGTAFSESAGFRLPDGAVLAPDASWVANERLSTLTNEQLERFLPLCPDFVVEIRSRTDRLTDLHAKLEQFIANGARLGWLIDPYERTVDIYRPGQEPEHLVAPERIAGDPELPNFLLELEPIWRGLRRGGLG